jgi:3,4-dihydroxy 2-butanone 4-phosphate synthase/GTP cyclohydrolase II
MFSPDFLPQLKQLAGRCLAETGLPLVTLSYAQSLDGSISHQHGLPLSLSGPESLEFTHRLRDAHDAVLVGIGTVLADDPRLTVRSIEGKDPRPVVLDSRLRLPSSARLWSHPLPPWIFCGKEAHPEARRALEARGAQVQTVPQASGRYLDLVAVLAALGERGVAGLMVEGGAEVITSFLSAGLVDRVVVTIAPVFVGGVRALQGRLEAMPGLYGLESGQYGRDVIVAGSFERKSS